MQRSSTSVGTLASALAKAQAEIQNPEKSLTATIVSPFPHEGSRTFRYAPLSSGLDLVRKCLGQHEIATVQTTTIDADSGLIRLTTTLVHASGEWVSSEWPVCPVSETAAPHRLGAALTYARRYALFTLVGIAGEDDLDAPDIPGKHLPAPSSARPARRGNGTAHPLPLRDAKGSADLRERLVKELTEIEGEEALALWAKRALPLKNELTTEDSKAVEAVYLAKVDGVPEISTGTPVGTSGQAESRPEAGPQAAAQVMPMTKPVRQRSKVHLARVGAQPCLVCKNTPCDPHHLKIAQPRTLGRKVSDEFTVPLCRRHHRELHQHGNERTWWQNQGIDPLPIAAALWQSSLESPPSETVTGRPRAAKQEIRTSANLRAVHPGPNDKTNPIPRPEAQ